MDPNDFFGIRLPATGTVHEATFMLLAVVLGAVVGYERERRGQPAGLRTHVIVCLGAALITFASIAFAHPPPGLPADVPGRIAANVVVGVGFLGAGAIIRDGFSVRGLTTAASIWTVAAIGMSVATSPHMAEIAILATAIVLVTLTLLTRLEVALKLRLPGRVLRVDIRNDDRAIADLLTRLARERLDVVKVESEEGHGEASAERYRRLTLSVRLLQPVETSALHAMLAAQAGVRSFTIE